MKRNSTTQRLLTASMLASAMAFTAPALAQGDFEPTRDISDSEYESAFEAFYADPADVQASVRYARLAIARGDYEVAAGVLERILLIAPDLAVLRAELGMLYARLGSYAVAKHHLEKAVASGQLTDERRERAETLLRRADKETSRHTITGTFQAGLRYQTNANYGTDNDQILANGVLAPATSPFDPDDDVNAFALLNFHYNYDFQTQHNTQLEADALLYASKQFSETENDVGLAQFKLGPSFEIAPESVRGLRLHPFVLLRGTFLEDDVYSGGLGGGLHVLYPVTDQVRLDLEFRAVEYFYNDTNERPQADDQDGLQLDGKVVLRYAPTDNIYLSLKARGVDKNADTGWNDYYQLGAEARVDILYQAPGDLTDGPWHTRFYVGYDYRDYDDPDPLVTLADTRDDDIYSFGAAQSVWFTDYDAVTAEVSATIVDSTIRNYDRDNVSGVLSYTRRF